MNAREKEAAGGAAASSDLPGGAQSRMSKFRRACRQVFGVPDYERYLEHCATHHPGEKPLSRAEFFARSIDRKYGKSGPRCC